jgi:hypothetical protein
VPPDRRRRIASGGASRGRHHRSVPLPSDVRLIGKLQRRGYGFATKRVTSRVGAGHSGSRPRRTGV